MIQYMNTLIRAALKDPKGVSALEYAILAAGIIGAIATVVGTVGGDVKTIFTDIAADLVAATPT